MFQNRPKQTKPAYTWKRVLTKKEFRNQEPSGRAGHVQFVLSSGDNRFWVHGGQAADGSYSDELFCFDTSKKIWSKHKLPSAPSARAYHGVCLCTPSAEVQILKGKKAVPRVAVYGGIEKGQLKKEVSLLEQWTAFSNKSAFAPTKNQTAWLQSDEDFEVGGSVPLPRCNHTMTTLDTGQHVLVFGGWHGRFVNDLYVLDTEHMHWSLRKARANPRSKVEFEVTPRAGHTAVLVRSQIFDRGPKGEFTGPALVCFGGQTDGGMQLDEVLVLDLTNWEWHRPRPHGREPVARSGHSACLVGNRIVIFGGWDGGKVRDDLHVLEIGGDMYRDWSWQDQIVRGAKVEGRIGHGAICLKNRIFLFGGIGKDQTPLGDLHTLEIPDHKPVSSATSTQDSGVAAVSDQDLAARIRRNQAVAQTKTEKTLDSKLDDAVQAVSRRIQVLNAVNRERHEAQQQEVAQNLREAKQKSVFDLVQNHGKGLTDALAIANGFNPEGGELVDVNRAASQIVAKYNVPQPPRDRARKPRSGNSAWHDAIVGGVEQVALEQIAVNGGLVKTWGALIDDGDTSEEEELEEAAMTREEEDVEDVIHATRYEKHLERELKGESLRELVRQQTEREFAFKQQLRSQGGGAQKKTTSPNRRPKRLVNVLGEAPLMIAPGPEMSAEIAKIANQGAVSTRSHQNDLLAIMDTLPQSKQPVPRGIVDSAMKIKALFAANLHRKRFERLRATVRIQAHVRRFITVCRLRREGTLRLQREEEDGRASGSGTKKKTKVSKASKKKAKKSEKRGFGSTQTK